MLDVDIGTTFQVRTDSTRDDDTSIPHKVLAGQSISHPRHRIRRSDIDSSILEKYTNKHYFGDHTGEVCILHTHAIFPNKRTNYDYLMDLSLREPP